MKRPSSIGPALAQQLTRRDVGRWLAVLAAAGAMPALACEDPAKSKPPSTAMPKPKEGVHDVVVIGGGLAGLAAAYMMKKHNVVLLEKEKVAGGRIRETVWEGFHISLGAAYTGKPTGDMKKWFDELGVKMVKVPPPDDAIAMDGKIYPGKHLPKLLKEKGACADFARVGKELMKLAKKGIGDAVYDDIGKMAKWEKYDKLTVADWMNKNKVHPLVQKYVDTENRGLFGQSSSDISLLWDIPEMSWNIYEPGAEAYCKAAGAADDEEEESNLWVFPKGMNELSGKIVKRLGGKVQTDATVTSVTVGADKIVTVGYTQGGKSKTLRAYAAVLATPAPVTARIVKSGLSAKVKAALHKVEYTGYVTLALFLSERVWSGSWNIACLDTPFTTLNDAIRTQVPAGYKKKGVLGVALPPMKAAQGAALVKKSDQQLVDYALEDIKRYFPAIDKKIVGRHVNRFEHAFPVFRPGYGRILARLHDDKTVRGPLFLAGDYMIYPTLGGAAISAEHAHALVEKYAGKLD